MSTYPIFDTPSLPCIDPNGKLIIRYKRQAKRMKAVPTPKPTLMASWLGKQTKPIRRTAK